MDTDGQQVSGEQNGSENLVSKSIFPEMNYPDIALDYLGFIVKESFNITKATIEENIRAKLGGSPDVSVQKDLFDCIKEAWELRDKRYPIIFKLMENEFCSVHRSGFSIQNDLQRFISKETGIFYKQLTEQYFRCITEEFQ